MTSKQSSTTRSTVALNPVVRIGIAALAIIVCLSLALTSVRAGYSRMLSRYALLTGSLERANDAVTLAPSDPESHRARAAVLHHLGQLPQAAKEYETAVTLRPLDDLLWLELGNVRDELDDSEGAVAALNESVRTAPYYGHPRWQRGNVLLREGRYDEAFADLRQAAASNKDLQPNLIDLAWGISKFDPTLTEQILQIDNDQMRLRFARLLALKGRGPEAVAQFRAAGKVPAQTRNEIVSVLIDEKAFNEASQIWLSGIASSTEKLVQPVILDGGFEGPLTFNERGFGWRFVRSDGLNLSVDPAERQSGGKSLRIQFDGYSNARTPPVMQLVLVEPSKRYRVNFGTRTQDIVSGALLSVTVTDATKAQLLAKSAALRQGTNDWQIQNFEFTTLPGTNAVFVSLEREGCSSAPCPIFGIVWLDSFSIEQLS